MSTCTCSCGYVHTICDFCSRDFHDGEIPRTDPTGDEHQCRDCRENALPDSMKEGVVAL